MKVIPRRRGGAELDENGIAGIVIGCAIDLHRDLGPGLLESVYEVLLADMLAEQGLSVLRQVPVPITYRGKTFLEAFRADLLIENKICIELKAVETVSKSDPKQLRTYLRLLDYRLGLLINFNAPLLKEGIVRIVNGLENDPYASPLRASAPPREKKP